MPATAASAAFASLPTQKVGGALGHFDRSLLAQESRRVKRAAVAPHLEMPAGIILPAKFTVPTQIGRGKSGFLCGCVQVRKFDAFIVPYKLPGG
jgi:hypothetical protein